ncbi:unnamed protein product, partial [Owenia fusiformis]
YHISRGNVTIDELSDQLKDIYLKERKAFKLRLSLGLVLSHRETGELRYFYPHNNESVLSEIILISNEEDLEQVIKKLREIDFEGEVWRYRPDTKWLPYRITNTREVTEKEKKQAVCFPTELPLFEDTFQININVYMLEEDGKVERVYNSTKKFEDTMNLNIYNRHLSYIKNMEMYSRKYGCRNCGKLFHKSTFLKRHETSCSKASILKFPGGYYKQDKNLFELLDSFGINIPDEQRYYPHVSCFDFEALLATDHEISNTKKIKWLADHQPVSVLLCSNLEGYKDPHCIINPDLDGLLEDMFTYLEKSKLLLLVICLID